MSNHVHIFLHISLAMAGHLDQYHINLYRQVVKTLDKNTKSKTLLKPEIVKMTQVFKYFSFQGFSKYKVILIIQILESNKGK